MPRKVHAEIPAPVTRLPQPRTRRAPPTAITVPAPAPREHRPLPPRAQPDSSFPPADIRQDMIDHLADRQPGSGGADRPVADRYLAARRAAGYTAYLTPKCLAPLLGYLRGLGVTPEPMPAEPATPAGALLEAYRSWLLGERGVTPAVARSYLDLVRPSRSGMPPMAARACALTAGDVTAFLTVQSRRLAPKTAQRLAAAPPTHGRSPAPGTPAATPGPAHHQPARRPLYRPGPPAGTASKLDTNLQKLATKDGVILGLSRGYYVCIWRRADR
jgi:hypothetical protein